VPQDATPLLSTPLLPWLRLKWSRGAAAAEKLAGPSEKLSAIITRHTSIGFEKIVVKSCRVSILRIQRTASRIANSKSAWFSDVGCQHRSCCQEKVV